MVKSSQKCKSSKVRRGEIGTESNDDLLVLVSVIAFSSQIFWPKKQTVSTKQCTEYNDCCVKGKNATCGAYVVTKSDLC